MAFRIFRWVIFLPLAFGASMLVYPVVIFLNSLFLLSLEEWLIGTYVGKIIQTGMASFASGATHVWVGATIAPKWKHSVALFLVGFYVTMMLIMLVLSIISGIESDPSILELLIVLFAGTSAGYEVSKEFAE